jgi:hypothetical protein
VNVRRRIIITVASIVAALVVLGYFTVPLFVHGRAEQACQMMLAGDGSYTTEWKPLPPAHWECVATPEGEPARLTDLGWWPTAPEFPGR